MEQTDWTDTSNEASKCMKRCSALLVIRKVENKSIMRRHYKPVRIAIKNTDKNKCWCECAVTGTLTHCEWECRLLQPLRKIYLIYTLKLSIGIASLSKVHSQQNMYFCAPKNMYNRENIVHHSIQVEITPVSTENG